MAELAGIVSWEIAASHDKAADYSKDPQTRALGYRRAY